MKPSSITRPSRAAVARAHRLDESDVAAAKAIIGDEFPAPPFHAVVCISAVRIAYEDRTWRTLETQTFHAGELTEKEILERFVQLVTFTGPVLLSYNGVGFDLPVIQVRAMLHRVQGNDLARDQYFRRYGDLHLDLCDTLANFENRNRVGLDVACRVLGVAGKVEGMAGAKVADLAEKGDFDAIGRYCLGDVAATVRLFLLLERFKNRLSEAGLQASLDDLDAALISGRTLDATIESM